MSKATIPQPAERERIERQTFTNGDRTWIYDINLITTEQAVTADEALSFKIDLLQRELESFKQGVEAGVLDWFWQCCGALLREVVEGQPVAHSPAQWMNAAKFVRELPYQEIARLRSCMEDFFISIDRESELSFVLKSASKKRSTAILSGFLMKELNKRSS